MHNRITLGWGQFDPWTILGTTLVDIYKTMFHATIKALDFTPSTIIDIPVCICPTNECQP